MPPALREALPPVTAEPSREVCGGCLEPVLVAIVSGSRVVADVHEWEPRARCFVCATIAARGQRRMNCDRCGGDGYVGHKRPPGRMLAIDVAWSDESHIRVIGPRTARRRGEALYRLHTCPRVDHSPTALQRRSIGGPPASVGRGPVVGTPQATAA